MVLSASLLSQSSKNRPRKKLLYGNGKGTFLPQKNLIELSKNLWPKNLNETPLGETGGLSNH